MVKLGMEMPPFAGQRNLLENAISQNVLLCWVTVSRRAAWPKFKVEAVCVMPSGSPRASACSAWVRVGGGSGHADPRPPSALGRRRAADEIFSGRGQRGRQTVSRWYAAWAEARRASLRRRPKTGRSCLLSAADWERLPIILARGAAAGGFDTERWTLRRMAVVVEHEIGVTCHFRSLGRVSARTAGRRIGRPRGRSSGTTRSSKRGCTAIGRG
jgi:transposase